MKRKTNDDEWISLSEFARRIGCAVGTVQKAITNGRIERRNGDKLIHWPTQSVNWEKNRDTSRIRNGVVRIAPNAGDPRPVIEEPSVTTSMSKAKLVTAVATAEIKKLQAGKMANTLVDKNLVEKAQFVFCRTFRDAVMNIPDRVSSEVGANMTEYIRVLVTEVLGLDAAKKILEKVDQAEVERVINISWTKESRYVLEHIRDYESNGVTGRS